jgi:amino acid transporter
MAMAFAILKYVYIPFFLALAKSDTVPNLQRSTWIALAGSIGLVLPSGSSVALLYGFIFCVLCCFCVAASLGELSAIWPTAGGQYHFVYALCTEKWRKPLVSLKIQFLIGSILHPVH